MPGPILGEYRANRKILKRLYRQSSLPPNGTRLFNSGILLECAVGLSQVLCCGELNIAIAFWLSARSTYAMQVHVLRQRMLLNMIILHKKLYCQLPNIFSYPTWDCSRYGRISDIRLCTENPLLHLAYYHILELFKAEGASHMPTCCCWCSKEDIFPLRSIVQFILLPLPLVYVHSVQCPLVFVQQELGILPRLQVPGWRQRGVPSRRIAAPSRGLESQCPARHQTLILFVHTFRSSGNSIARKWSLSKMWVFQKFSPWNPSNNFFPLSISNRTPLTLSHQWKTVILPDWHGTKLSPSSKQTDIFFSIYNFENCLNGHQPAYYWTVVAADATFSTTCSVNKQSL